MAISSILSQSQRTALSENVQGDYFAQLPFLDMMERAGNIMPHAGENIEFPFSSEDLTTIGSNYGPGAEIETTQRGEIITLTLPMDGAFQISDQELGWYMDRQGKTGDLASGTLRKISSYRLKELKDIFFGALNYRLHRDGGTSNQFLGVEEWVPDNPATGTICGLARATYPSLMSHELDGGDGDSGDWDADCWELLLRMRLAIEEHPTRWGGRQTPDVGYCSTSSLMKVLKLGFNQNTNLINAKVETIDMVAGVALTVNMAVQSNSLYMLTSKNWKLFFPPGRGRFIDVDVRANFEDRMNPRDTAYIASAEGQLYCEWMPGQGVITNAV
jgi:hypothetical protein